MLVIYHIEAGYGVARVFLPRCKGSETPLHFQGEYIIILHIFSCITPNTECIIGPM